VYQTVAALYLETGKVAVLIQKPMSVPNGSAFLSRYRLVFIQKQANGQNLLREINGGH